MDNHPHRDRSDAKLTIGGVPQKTDAHVLMVGSTGTAKTLAMMQIAHDALRRGDTVVVIGGREFMHHFYTEATGDAVHAPLDSRARRWDLGKDLKTREDVETFAESYVPVDHRQLYGESSLQLDARRLLADVTQQVLEKGARDSRQVTATDVYQAIAVESNDSVRKLLDSADSKVLTPEDRRYRDRIQSEAGLSAMRATAASGINTLNRGEEEQGPGFSMREFLQGTGERPRHAGDRGKMMFVPYDAHTVPAMRGHMTHVANFVLSDSMSRNPQGGRTVVIVDELGLLRQAKNLPRALARQPEESRVQVALSTQSLDQVREAQGRENMDKILAGTDTLALRSGTGINGGTAEELTRLIGNPRAIQVASGHDWAKANIPPRGVPADRLLSSDIESLRRGAGYLITKTRDSEGNVTGQSVHSVQISPTIQSRNERGASNVDVPQLSAYPPSIRPEVLQAVQNARSWKERSTGTATLDSAKIPDRGISD